MGAEESLRAAASGLPLAAVVADGAGASTLGDDRAITNLPPLKSIVDRVHLPVLLIASNASNEATIDRLYARRIGRTAALWSVPDAGHTEALRKHPREYAVHVLRFLDAALQTQP